MIKKGQVENMFTRFDTIHERDRQTDTTRRHRPRYAQRRAAKSDDAAVMLCATEPPDWSFAQRELLDKQGIDLRKEMETR